MVIDTLDKIFVNSPLKHFMQKYFEMLIFKKFIKSNEIHVANNIVLEAGCGSGFGLQLIQNDFHPISLHGFDILSEQVLKARKRNLSAHISIENATNIHYPAMKFDVVFVFTVLHHIPEYPKALKEISRVLKPGGYLLIDELNKRLLDFFEKFFGVKHPKRSRFSWPEFYIAIEKANMIIIDKKILPIGFGLFLCKKKDF
ncbi:MAG: class I SAM-dependent methyltransferase [Candidatus Lokiarchaeota archaeon]